MQCFFDFDRECATQDAGVCFDIIKDILDNPLESHEKKRLCQECAGRIRSRDEFIGQKAEVICLQHLRQHESVKTADVTELTGFNPDHWHDFIQTIVPQVNVWEVVEHLNRQWRDYKNENNPTDIYKQARKIVDHILERFRKTRYLKESMESLIEDLDAIESDVKIRQFKKQIREAENVKNWRTLKQIIVAFDVSGADRELFSLISTKERLAESGLAWTKSANELLEFLSDEPLSLDIKEFPVNALDETLPEQEAYGNPDKRREFPKLEKSSCKSRSVL